MCRDFLSLAFKAQLLWDALWSDALCLICTHARLSHTLSWGVGGGRAYRQTRKRFTFPRIERAAKTEWEKKKLINASAQSSTLSKHLRNGDSQHSHGTDVREWGWFTGRSIGGNAQLSCSARILLYPLGSSVWMEQPPNPSSLITHTFLRPWNLFPYDEISR